MCMYMDMYMYMIPFAEHWSVRCTARSNSWSLKFAFRHNFARSTHRILREGSSSRMKMCVSLQRRACKSMEMYVSLQWRVRVCKMYEVWGEGGGPYHGGGVATRDTEPYIYIYVCTRHINILYVYIYINLYIYIVLKGWCYFRESCNGSSQCWFDFKYVSSPHVPRKKRSIQEHCVWYLRTTYWA